MESIYLVNIQKAGSNSLILEFYARPQITVPITSRNNQQFGPHILSCSQGLQLNFNSLHIFASNTTRLQFMVLQNNQGHFNLSLQNVKKRIIKKLPQNIQRQLTRGNQQQQLMQLMQRRERTRHRRQQQRMNNLIYDQAYSVEQLLQELVQSNVRVQRSSLYVPMKKKEGIQKQQLKKIPVEKFTKKFIIKKNGLKQASTNLTCSICLMDYKQNQYLRNLKCKHKFHKQCVDDWLQKKANCPVCKKKIE